MNDPNRIDIIGHVALLLLVATFAVITSTHVVQPFLASQENISNFREAVGILSRGDGSLDRLDEEISRVGSAIAASEAMLPAEINLDAFLDQIGDLAARRGIRVEILTPSQIRQHRLFRELVIEIHVRGPFHSITEFMSKVEGGDRLSRINNLTMVPERDSGVCSARMSLALYFAPEGKV
jgi:Tfp pilus assembly protein PilO